VPRRDPLRTTTLRLRAAYARVAPGDLCVNRYACLGWTTSHPRHGKDPRATGPIAGPGPLQRRPFGSRGFRMPLRSRSLRGADGLRFRLPGAPTRWRTCWRPERVSRITPVSATARCSLPAALSGALLGVDGHALSSSQDVQEAGSSAHDAPLHSGRRKRDSGGVGDDRDGRQPAAQPRCAQTAACRWKGVS
jgi:hypothetical protein